MPTNPQQLLEALKFELYFLERGGYERSVREPRQELSVFRDSPSCLNYGLEARKYPCSDCFLINFVPPEKREESRPCHHILLNDRGDTLETLQGWGHDFEVQEALRAWLKKTIADLEADLVATSAKA